MPCVQNSGIHYSLFTIHCHSERSDGTLFTVIPSEVKEHSSLISPYFHVITAIRLRPSMCIFNALSNRTCLKKFVLVISFCSFSIL
jgi:hypothetical protein